MVTWIVLLTLIVPRPADTTVAGIGAPDATEMRYRGIDRLLEKFDREWSPPAG